MTPPAAAIPVDMIVRDDQEIPFATHGTVAYLAIPGLMTWLDRTVP